MNVENLREKLRKDLEEISDYLNKKDLTREQIIRLGRDVIRESGYAITSLHTGDEKEAHKHLKVMKSTFRKVWELSKDYPEIKCSGLMNNIASEFVEAEIFYGLITHNSIPTHIELGVGPAQYVQGLLDVIGELKRYILERLRKNDFENAERLFQVAELIYEYSKTFDFPEPVLPGIRRKVDVARAIVESLRSLITDLESRKRLIEALAKCTKELQLE